MKFVHGWWIPDSDAHHEVFLKGGPQIEGRGTYQYAKFERAMKHVPQDKRRLALDVGAHVGFWTLQLARTFRHVHAFEPMPQHLECFKQNITGDNVILLELALSNEVGLVPMYWNPRDTGAAHIVASGEPVTATNQVKTVRLDDYNFEFLDFVKIDVEGMEWPMVMGAKETILKHRPVIIIEQKPNGNAERYGRHRFAALDQLKSWGGVVRWEMGGDFLVEWR